jgi:hypothetical protein
LIRQPLATPRQVSYSLFDGLADADLVVHPGHGINHIIWQFGPMITSEHRMLTNLFPDLIPRLSHGFSDAHGPTRAKNDGPAGF